MFEHPEHTFEHPEQILGFTYGTGWRSSAIALRLRLRAFGLPQMCSSVAKKMFRVWEQRICSQSSNMFWVFDQLAQMVGWRFEYL